MDKPASSSAMLTLAEAAARIGMSRRWLGDQVRKRTVEHTRFGTQIRFTEAQLDQLMRDHAVKPKPQALDTDSRRHRR